MLIYMYITVSLFFGLERSVAEDLLAVGSKARLEFQIKFQVLLRVYDSKA